MSEAILLTGKRGEGKTLIATMLAKRYLSQNRPIATNVNFNLDKMVSPLNKTHIYRLPDAPSSSDLKSLPVANAGYDESKNGLLLLDEASGFLNSHDWRDNDTKQIRFWLAQSRKDGWDLLFLAQDQKQIDAQIRNSLFELHGIARNMSKVGIPVLSFLFQWFFNVKLRMPAMHVFTQRYGFGLNAAMANTEMIRGGDLYDAYDTKQKIDPNAAEAGNPQLFGSAMATMLSAWHLKGRYMGVFELYGKIAFIMLLLGSLIGWGGGFFYARSNNQIKVSQSLPVSIVEPEINKDIKVIGKYQIEGRDFVLLSDGREKPVTQFKIDLNGSYYKIDGAWFSGV